MFNLENSMNITEMNLDIYEAVDLRSALCSNTTAAIVAVRALYTQTNLIKNALG